jgi:hypothetical protein
MSEANTSKKPSSIISSRPRTGVVSHPNGGRAFCAFFNFRCISADWLSHELMLDETGVENSSVAESGSSVREKPELEKSFQERVSLFSERD